MHMESHEITLRFTYHSPSEDQTQRYQKLRSLAKDLAMLIDDAVPESREKSLAVTKLEEVVMWANAGIARREEK